MTKHALLTPSGAARWLFCTAAPLIEAKLPATTSPYAEEGTLAHKIAELKLENYIHPMAKGTMTRRLNKLKKDPNYAPEMDSHTDAYIEQINRIVLTYEATPFIVAETRVDLSRWIPECYGTADCIIIGGNNIHVVDFKYGKGVPVSAVDNPQLLLYALGAYARYSLLYPITSVTMSICQPRLDHNTKHTVTVNELLAFAERVKAKAEEALAGGSFAPAVDVCRFCRAKETCRARAEEAVALVKDENIGKAPEELSLKEIGDYLKKGAIVSKWLEDLKGYALSQSLAGHEVVGWKAVAGRSSRVWKDQDAAFTKITASGIDEALLYERKPLSLAQVEKVMGKKAFEDTVGDLVERQPGKPTLVEDTDKRPAITNKTAAEAFGQEKGV